MADDTATGVIAEAEASESDARVAAQTDQSAVWEQRLAALENGLYGVITEVRGVQGRADSAHTIIATVQSELEEKYAPKQALALLEKTVRTTLGDEAWEQHQRDSEIVELRRQVNKKPAEAPKPETTQEDDWARTTWPEHVTDLNEELTDLLGDAKAETWTNVRARMRDGQAMKSYATPTNPRGDIGWLRDFRKQAKAIAAEKSEQDSTAEKTTLNTQRAAAGPGAKPTWAQIQKMSPAQIAAISDADMEAAIAKG